MKISIKIKKDISRIIAEYFSANKIKNILIFSKIIPDETFNFINLLGIKKPNSNNNKLLFVHQKIIFDVLKKISNEKELTYLLTRFCLPWNFKRKEIHQEFIHELNEIINPIFTIKYKNNSLFFDKPIKKVGGKRNNIKNPLDKIPGIDKINTEMFTVSLNDREIRVNDYILAKPHAVGTNMSFFEYVFNRPNENINIEEIPDMIRQDFGWKSISKLLNALGFTGEVMKAFFPKRTNKKPRILRFTKSVSLNDLKQSGIKIGLFVKTLEMADIKNNK